MIPHIMIGIVTIALKKSTNYQLKTASADQDSRATSLNRNVNGMSTTVKAAGAAVIPIVHHRADGTPIG